MDNKTVETPPSKIELEYEAGKVELTEEQLREAATLGLNVLYRKKMEENKPKEEPKKEEAKKEDDDITWAKNFRKEQEAKAQTNKARNEQLAKLDLIAKEIKSDEELKDWHEEMLHEVVGIAALKQIKAENTEDGQLDLAGLIKDVKAKYKEKVGKMKPVTDVKKKLADAAKTEATVPGKNDAGTSPKTYGREAFRSKDFLKGVINTIGKHVKPGDDE